MRNPIYDNILVISLQ